MAVTPLAIDLYCGLGGWTEGLLAEGYRVVGFDNERHQYGEAKYPAQLVIQDVLTLHGSQFKDAALIVASPPCQEYSYMAMPWSLAKEKRARILADAEEQKRLTALFDACFRIQREASEAAGRHIPLVVENVKGAQPWVGRAAWHFGSFYLWGDIPALMPIVKKAKLSGRSLNAGEGKWRPANGLGFELSDQLKDDAYKTSGMNWNDRTKHGQDFTRIAGNQAIKNNGGSWFNVGSPGQKETGRNPVNAHTTEGRKHEAHDPDAIGWFGKYKPGNDPMRNTPSKSKARKAASAAIAKIPFVLAQHIARSWKPCQ